MTRLWLRSWGHSGIDHEIRIGNDHLIPWIKQNQAARIRAPLVPDVTITSVASSSEGQPRSSAIEEFEEMLAASDVRWSACSRWHRREWP